jgi:cytochrome c2
MRPAVGALVLGVALVAAAPGGGIPGAHAAREALSGLLPGSPQEGSRLFVTKGCVRCHAVLGDGGTAGPDLGRLALKRPLLELAGVMWNHSPKMDAIFLERGLRRPALEPEQMASLLAFLYSLTHLDKPGDAVAGARLFAAKGCRTCHALGGSGGDVGPKLDKYSRYTSPLFLATALWKHGPAMAKAMREHKVPRPSFKDDDIPDLMAFIHASGPGVERVYARPGNPARGEELFAEKRCVECHALRGQGGKVGPDLGEPGRLTGSLTGSWGPCGTAGPRM